MSKDTAKHDIYIEKVAIYERKSLKLVIMVIYKENIYFLYADKFNIFMRPIGLNVDIVSLKKCQMNEAQSFQYVALELNHTILKDQYKNRSHIIFVQLSKSNNFGKLHDFITLKRL